MVGLMKIIGWLVQHGWALLLVGGLLIYIGFSQIKGECPLCVVFDKIDAQTRNEAAAGKLNASALIGSTFPVDFTSPAWLRCRSTA